MAAKGTVLSRSTVAKMMATARNTIADAQRLHLEGYHLRQTDPFERAKLALQRARVVVFSHSLHVPGSTLIVVGNRPMEREDVIAYAERWGRW